MNQDSWDLKDHLEHKEILDLLERGFQDQRVIEDMKVQREVVGLLVLGSKVTRAILVHQEIKVQLVLLVQDFKEKREIRVQLGLQDPKELQVLE